MAKKTHPRVQFALLVLCLCSAYALEIVPASSRPQDGGSDGGGGGGGDGGSDVNSSGGGGGGSDSKKNEQPESPSDSRNRLDSFTNARDQLSTREIGIPSS